MYKEILCDRDSKVKFVQMSTKEITNYENWEYNRHLNEDKVNEIKNNLRTKSLLDTVLSYVYIPNDNKYILFDGQHRFKAMKELYDNENIIINCLCYVYYINELNYKNDKTKIDKIIKDLFINKNLQTPLADIDIERLEQIDSTLNINTRSDIIHSVFLDYRNNFSKFYSTSNNPQRPNFNCCNFKNLCNKYEFNTKEELQNRLLQENEEQKINYIKNEEQKINYIKNKISEKMIKKCSD